MSESNMIFYENKLLGYPRMRMLKVNNKSCEVVNSFRREITQCFGKYSEANEDQTPIGSEKMFSFEYQSAEILDSESYWGEISTYGGGGFVQDLSSNDPNETLARIATLKENRWIDRGTRVVFIDFSLYNANINLFCIIK
uniref:Polycystin domain-containing protein n=1 Tax=Acrobeloides nanus TaxID=290746 RepID=A0A914CCJ3_9BILA